ncbi:hypothetical protein AB0D14_27515 [Streptomyces sp. NPDC048484]|uniref:hypothetical protein n=1 Tax=Streptomyces sp. NPDC048484 TaxID=3155146 RepID=UPI00342E2011
MDNRTSDLAGYDTVLLADILTERPDLDGSYRIMWLAGICELDLTQHCLKAFGERDRPHSNRCVLECQVCFAETRRDVRQDLGYASSLFFQPARGALGNRPPLRLAGRGPAYMLRSEEHL